MYLRFNDSETTGCTNITVGTFVHLPGLSVKGVGDVIINFYKMHFLTKENPFSAQTKASPQLNSLQKFHSTVVLSSGVANRAIGALAFFF